MKFNLTLGVVDKPGQLLKAFEPIAKNGGNIVSVIHDRENPGGYVPVSLVVDFPSKENFNNTKKELEKINIPIIKSEEAVERANTTLILIGKSDLKRFIENIESKEVKILDFEVSSPNSERPCAKINIEAPPLILNDIIQKLKRTAKKENLILIPSW